MDPLPPDPYAALGLPRDTPQATIKTTYKKLALKTHPDKNPNQSAVDEFHKIQQAYECIGNEDDRKKYDALYSLHQQRRQQPQPQQQRQSQPHQQWAPAYAARSASYDFDIRDPPPPTPSFVFTPRGPTAAPSYDTQERRPNSSTPRATSYFYEPADYFSHSGSSRPHYDFFEPATSTRRSSHPSSKSKDDERKSESKKEKANATSKVRHESKKARDKERGSDRRSKAASIDLDSDDDDDEPPYSTSRRYDSTREAYVRRKESKRSDDDLAERRARTQENIQTENVKDYIRRARAELPIQERVTSMPSYQSDSRRGSAEEPPVPPEPRSSTRRPETSRTASSSKADKRPSQSSESSRPKTSSSRKTTGGSARRSVSPEAASDRRVPPLFTAASSPADIKIPSPDPSGRRTRTHEGTPVYEERVAPSMRRSETAPSKSSRHGRREDSAPNVSSNLRYGETTGPNDSGFFSSNGADEVPPPPSRQREAKSSHRHSPDQKTTPVFRESDRQFTRSPSPEMTLPTRERERERDWDSDRERDRPSTKDRDRPSKAPPISRSASYAVKNDSSRVSDSDRTPPSSRRPSVQRTESSRKERPSMERSGSSRVSSRKVPDLTRGASSPVPSRLRTGGGASDARDRDGPLFGELRRSPVDFQDSDFEDFRPKRGSTHETRPSARYFHDLDDGYASPAAYRERKMSELDARTRAESYMSQSRAASGTKPELRRQETLV